MTNLTKITLSAVTIALLSGCGDTTVTQTPSNVTIDNSVNDSNNANTNPTDPTDPTNPTEPGEITVEDLIKDAASLPRETLAGELGPIVASTQPGSNMKLAVDTTGTNITLTADTLWVLDGLVVVAPGVTLTIEPGTVIAGRDGTGDSTSYMIVDKGAEIIADARGKTPIVFTSLKRVENFESNEVGQWGGLTIIGHAGNDQVNPYEVNTAFEADATDMTDSSGILGNVSILNSGITMEQDKEINGLSFVGVGSGTVVEDITVDYSDDDGIEIWGGTVNLTNINITNCTDDYFDIDDGYTGTVKNLVINTTTGNAGIEMSGQTAATFDGFSITTGATQAKEGGIYFKKDGIGGHFKNGTIIHNGGVAGDAHGAIHSKGTADVANVSFENVAIAAPAELSFTGDSAAEIKAKFDSGSNNNACATPTSTTLSGDLTGCTVLTADKVWELDGLVVVTEGSELIIQEGTTIVGLPGTGDSTSYMIVDKGAKIQALGTAEKPIVFTSQDQTKQEVGLWGGLTIIGHAGNDQVNPYEVNTAFEADATDMADSSGVLKHVKILNSGITMEQDKEINGLSFVGVGSGTVVEDITVDYSDDDGIEIWGGTVNLTNVKITNCTDDYFDIDDGYTGTVKNLVINTTTGNAGIEMSGVTAATFDGFDITTGATQAKEGGIYFKKDGIGGHFKNGTITHNGGVAGDAHGAIHSKGTFDADNTSFENVAIVAPVELSFTGDSATGLEAKFDSGSNNDACAIPTSTTLSGDLTGCSVLTADKVWELDGLVVVTDESKLIIEEGTTIVGLPGTGDSTSYMIVDKGAKIQALGTAEKPIVFTSQDQTKQEVGLWGGLTIIGHAGNDQVNPYEVNTAFEADATDMADSSGVLKHVKILNSGITMEQDKEINGLSFVGVGSGTVVEDITVDYSDDDGIEIWGGTVNLTNVKITNCTDDYFDIDDGYTGTVKNLVINTTTGNAGIEMSGVTAATFDGFDITTGATQAKEGGIYFKKDGIGGHFKNGTITHNGGVAGDAHGAIHSKGTFDADNTSFENVAIVAPVELSFTGDSATDLEAKFDAGTGNTK